MRCKPAVDDDGHVVLSATEAAWLAKTSEQNLRNWLRAAPHLVKPLSGKHAVIRFADLQRLLSDRDAPPPLDPEWLSVRPDDPPPSVWRPRNSGPDGVAHGETAQTGPGTVTPDLPAAKAAQAAAAAELSQAWQREREAAKDRDRWRIAAAGYREALTALVAKDGRLDELTDQPP